MLAFALRRAIWAIPTLFGVSLVVFLLTTLLPDPTLEAGKADLEAKVRLDELRRARFLDLPRFVNVEVRDVRARIDECVAHITQGSDDAALCKRRLARIGGAGLPYLLPDFDTLPPGPRGEIALALGPVAERMGVTEDGDFATADRAVLFWKRFWEDRSVDFTEPAVRRSVQRLVRRGGDQLRGELRGVDTFALKLVIPAMRQTRDADALARLVLVASHATGRENRLAPGAPAEMVRSVVSEWQSWWYVHETDYVALEGGDKVTASIGQTRYAKWVLGAVTGQLGLSTRDGVPIVDKLLDCAPVTLGMAVLALFVSLAVAVPVGVAAAWRQGRTFDRTVMFFVLAIYSVPTFLAAELLVTLGRGRSQLALAVVTLATVSLAAMTQHQRASMIDAMSQDYVRAARAKGARTLRVAVVHALRNALVPTVTLAGVQIPALVGGAFVVEEIFGIRGMGWETLRAIEARDVAWVVAVTLLCGVVTTASLVASDLAYGVLDLRVRERQNRGRA